MKACLLRHEQAASYASASRLTFVRSIYLAKHEEYCTFCLFLALWMNVVQWAGLLCCQLCFWSTPCLIVSMVSFFPLPIANREGGTCLLQWHCSCWLESVIRLWETLADDDKPSKDMPEPKGGTVREILSLKRTGWEQRSGCHTALSETWECWEVLSVQL